jgi:hypothetical protein
MRTLKALILVILFTGVNYIYAQTARLQVIHNAADPAADSVDVYLNGTLLLDNFAFRAATEFIDAPADTVISIGVAGKNSTSASDTLKNFVVTLTSNETYVAIANGVLDPNSFQSNPDGRSTAFTLFIKDMARETGNSGDVDFFVLHGSTDAPTVDVIARDVLTLVDDAKYKDITDYITVPAGEYTLDVTPGSDNSTIVASFAADLSGLGGGSAVVFASGFLTPSANQNGEAFGIFAALANGTVVEFPAISTARFQVIHNAADPAAAVVDIYLKNLATDEQLLKLDDFGFREATEFEDVPADVNLAVIVAGPGSTSDTNQVVTTIPVGQLANGGKYVVIANGVLNPGDFATNPDSKDIAFTLLVNSMAQERASGSDVDFFVLHGSTDAPTVDVIARDVATLVDDAAYGDITPYITVPPAAYTLDLTLADGTTLVQSYVADLSGLGGGSAAVFASGFLTPANNQNGEAFGLFFALADGTVGQFPEGVTSVEEISSLTPNDYNLSQNYPNPFNPSTTINFTLPNNEFVTLKVYNVLGSEVATLVNQQLTAGSYKFDFNASNLASGIYLYELKAGSYSQIKKMNLLK